jgi:hypothetical protein
VDGEFQEFKFIDEEFEHGGVEDEDPSQGFVDWDSPPTYDDDVNVEDPIEESLISDQVEEINLSESITIFYEEDEPLEDVSLSESFAFFHKEEVNLSNSFALFDDNSTYHVPDKSPEDKIFNFGVKPIDWVDFIGINAILSNSSNQLGDEICMTGERREKHDNVDKLDFWQTNVQGNQDYHHRLLMIKGVKCILGCCLVVILRNGEWNELTGHPKDCGKDSLNLGQILSNLGRMM